MFIALFHSLFHKLETKIVHSIKKTTSNHIIFFLLYLILTIYLSNWPVMFPDSTYIEEGFIHLGQNKIQGLFKGPKVVFSRHYANQVKN